jgi:hypothetical protein
MFVAPYERSPPPKPGTKAALIRERDATGKVMTLAAVQHRDVRPPLLAATMLVNDRVYALIAAIPSAV